FSPAPLPPTSRVPRSRPRRLDRSRRIRRVERHRILRPRLADPRAPPRPARAAPLLKRLPRQANRRRQKSRRLLARLPRPRPHAHRRRSQRRAPEIRRQAAPPLQSRPARVIYFVVVWCQGTVPSSTLLLAPARPKCENVGRSCTPPSYVSPVHASHL